MRFVVTLTVAIFVFATPALSAVELNKLSDCSGLKQLYDSLAAPSSSLGKSCRSPRSALENALVSRMGAVEPKMKCVLSSAPNNSLANFSCFHAQISPGVASLACFRATPRSDIEKYKANYEDAHAPAVAAYLTAAAKCPVSNGDASIAPRTLFPAQLALIAKVQFGYVLGLGRGRVVKAQALHGYALVDPQLHVSEEAIEYVEVFVSATAPKTPDSETSATSEPDDTGKRIGSWSVKVDEGEDFERNVSEQMRRSRIPARIEFLGFDITQKKGAAKPMSEKQALQLSWQRVLVASIERANLELLSESEIEEKTGRTMREFRAEIMSRAPFGMPQGVEFGDKIFILLDEYSHDCTDDGAITASVISTKPEKNVATDLGSVGIIVTGVGRCSSSRMEDFLSEVAHRAGDSLFNTLGKN